MSPRTPSSITTAARRPSGDNANPSNSQSRVHDGSTRVAVPVDVTHATASGSLMLGVVYTSVPLRETATSVILSLRMSTLVTNAPGRPVSVSDRSLSGAASNVPSDVTYTRCPLGAYTPDAPATDTRETPVRRSNTWTDASP